MNMDDFFEEEEAVANGIERLKWENKRDRLILQETKSEKVKRQIIEDINRRNRMIEEEERRLSFAKGAGIFGIIFSVISVIITLVIFLTIVK